MLNCCASNGIASLARYTPNSSNGLSAIRTASGSNPTQTTGLDYDQSGNLTTQTASDGSKTIYSYDDLDRLASIEQRAANGTPQTRSDYLYDGASRLRVSREWTFTAGTWTQASEKRRVYDGMSVVQERDASNAVTASYTRGGEVGGILARTTGTTTPYHAFYHYDGSGNVTSITDQQGDSIANYDYDAFGNTLEASGSYASRNVYRFSTKEAIGNGLYNYGFRFYSPGMGRWINRDPLKEMGGFNRYAFVGNNPVNLFDADGLSFKSFVKGFAVGAGISLVSAYLGAAAVGFATCAVPELVPILTALGEILGAVAVAQTIEELWRLWKNEDGLCPDARDEAIGNLLGGLVGGMIGGKAGSKVSEKFGFCFVAGTPILMGDGTSKPIEQVKAGDVVLSKNEKSGQVEKQKVTDSWSKTAPATLLLTFADGTKVETTDEHPFYVEKAGFTAAKEVGIGTSIVTRAGPALQLVAKQVKDAPQTVFNFSVQNTNSYFVSDKALWVHNARNCAGTSGGNPSKKGDPYHPDEVAKRSYARRTRNDDLPKDPRSGDLIPDPNADGRPHTVLGRRNNPTETAEPYNNAVSFGDNGVPMGKTDFTNHFPMRDWQNHPNPHYHPWNGRKFLRGPYDMP